MTLSMSIGRDYRTSDRYEFVIYEDEQVIAREGFFGNSRKARRKGLECAKYIQAERDRIAPQLAL